MTEPMVPPHEPDPKQAALRRAGSKINSPYAQAEARRKQMIELVAAGNSIAQACEKVGVRQETHRKWRQKYPEYAMRIDASRLMAAGEDISVLRNGQKAMDFGTFRKEILGMDSPWFHLEAVKWLEEAPPGSITLMLWPPEHGKTTLLEDFCTWKLSMDPGYRIGVGSGRQAHSSKVLRRVQNRMEDDGPFPQLIRQYGPFAPQTGLGNRKAIQPWGSNFFRVFQCNNADERDFSMTALGITAEVVGSRMDLLVLDDVQSLTNLSQTEQIVDRIRQDWLSRPGTKGRTIIIGTRVGEVDVYTELEKAEIIDKLILFRAHDQDGQWLWPERYSPEEYALMRRNVGEQGWERNYMQRTTVKGERTFTEQMTTDAQNPMRAVFHDPPSDAVGLVVGLDPGFGVNVCIAAAATPKKLVILGGREDLSLTSNQQIFNVVEGLAFAHATPQCPWVHLVMEDKAFQKGLFGDDGLKAMRERYGFTVGGHQTGVNKYDPNLGIAAMARSFSRLEIEIPGSDDEQTKRFTETLVAELHRWRPNMRGTKLKQDYVMALWFVWMWWMKHKESLVVGMSGDFSFDGLPWATAGSGLVLPTGAYGRAS